MTIYNIKKGGHYDNSVCLTSHLVTLRPILGHWQGENLSCSICHEIITTLQQQSHNVTVPGWPTKDS